MKNSHKFFCDNCGAQVEGAVDRCPSCGRFFAAIRCPKCGFSGGEEAFLDGCPSCGYSSRASRAAKKPRVKKRRSGKTGEKSNLFYAAAVGILILILTVLLFNAR
ncbi:MAG: zinc ribbon domain-containing protein [Spirochaetaceae bacterium]|jgi:predicted RNA-binding Zn-ribbon protein involved in translation (DUF1610 family)|nr:zinc ribbon domain-containing protein [Spirochaetaceae bacterium]